MSMKKIKFILKELIVFSIKQAQASIFGIILVLVIVISGFMNFEIIPISRYDFIFIVAIIIQIMLIITKAESINEAKVIIIFHILAVIMELFKTNPQIGSWTYPENNGIFKINSVPLFTGFLYSAVGSYIVRAWKILDLEFEKFPSLKELVYFSIISYINFFTHHFIFDLRIILFVWSFIMFYKTKVYFTLVKTRRSMSLFMGILLVSLFIYLAENIATYMHIWLYPNQVYSWHMVHIGKIGSWFLLIIVSFTLVSLIQNIQKNK